MDFEHAIKMDVRNNPIVRELDRARQRELWRWMLVGGALVGVILFSLWQRFSVMRVATQIETVQRDMSKAAEQHRRLLLEAEQLASPQRIERLATKQRMVHADHTTTRFIAPAAEGTRGEQAGAHAVPQVVARSIPNEAHR